MNNKTRLRFTVTRELVYLNYVLQLFGLMPLNLHSPLTFINFLYPILVICTLIFFLVRSLIEIHKKIYKLFSAVTFVAIHLQLFSLGMASCLSVIGSVTRYHIYTDFIAELLKVDTILIRELNIQIDKYSTRTQPSPNKYLTLHIFGLIILVSTDYLLIHTGPIYLIDYVVIFHIFFTIISIADCRVLATFRQLSHRFELINHFFFKVNKANRFRSTFQVIPYRFTKSEIKSIAKVHGSLVTAAENLNSYFSPHLLVEIASYFTISTCNAYNFFYVLTSKSSTEYHRLIVYYSAYWPIVVIVKLCLLLRSCVTLTSQVCLI